MFFNLIKFKTKLGRLAQIGRTYSSFRRTERLLQDVVLVHHKIAAFYLGFYFIYNSNAEGNNACLEKKNPSYNINPDLARFSVTLYFCTSTIISKATATSLSCLRA